MNILTDYLKHNNDFKIESQKCDFTSSEFAKKLMGQIVFLYFLQKKGWLGVQLIPKELSIKEYNSLMEQNDSVSQKLINNYFKLNDNNVYVIEKTKLRMSELEEDIVNLTNIFSGSKYDEPWGTGDKSFVRTIYKQCIKEHRNFFDECLELFFYKGLNEKRENQYFPMFNCKVPFLNGGLFEPLNNYRWSSAHFNIPNETFSNSEHNGILDFLDLYNFTIDEEEPLEKDIAVDPEMLGKIFENLLDVDDRKSKGAFYTPREIVYYMCQESLANYLVNKLGVDHDEVIKFIKYGDLISQCDWNELINKKEDFLIGKTIFDKIVEIDKALIDIKVADPAVGSGAFPLGMLTEIVKLRNNLSIYIMIQNELGIISIDSLIETNQHKRDIFDMKLQTIENSIYAVDVETSAVDIAKLRLWLSLIVDYPNTEEPRPLPNLDCKIMQGNSLIDDFEGVPLFSKKILEKSMKKKTSAYQQSLFRHSSSEIQIQQSLQFDDGVNLNIFIDTMLDLQKQYFNTSNTKFKKDLKNKIEKIQIAMIEESLKYDSEKLKSFREESKKRQKPWFIWELEFFDVFKDNNGFDIVIGNPPYVDSEQMSKDDKELRNTYSKKYKTAKGNWDMFILFIELGYILSKTNGIISFIIPNKLISANYSKEIRNYMSNYSINEIRDYSNVKVFKEAYVYPVTIVCEKNKNRKEVKMSVMNNLTESSWINDVSPKVFYSNINWDIYFSEKTEYTDLINKLMKNEIISDSGIFVKGAATVGEAYEIKKLLYDAGVDVNQLNETYKFINTGTIDPYQILWGKKNTQYIKDKYEFPVVDKKALIELLPKRYKDATNKKIIIGGMTKILECVLDVNGEYLAGKSTIVLTSESIDLKYVIALLNSKLMSFYYRVFYNSSSLEGGFYSINTEQIKNLPFIYNEKYKTTIIGLVDKLLTEFDSDVVEKINKNVYSIFNLDSNEIQMVEDYFDSF
jgi:hypothetical protein